MTIILLRLYFIVMGIGFIYFSFSFDNTDIRLTGLFGHISYWIETLGFYCFIYMGVMAIYGGAFNHATKGGLDE